MPKLPLRIEVVRTNSKGLSSMGTPSASAIVESLGQHYTHVVLTHINTEADLAALVARKPDLVFLGMNYILDDTELHAKIWLSDVLQKDGIRFTGSGKFASRLGLNKHLAKQRMIENGLQTSPYQIIPIEDEEIVTEGKLTFPLFVKPTNKGGGQGIDHHSVVHTTEELQAKVASIHDTHLTDALVEEFLVGREFSVAIIEDELTGSLVAMPLELVAKKDINGERILGSALKLTNTTTILEVSDPTERTRLTAFAIDAFKALGAHDYGRIDIRCDKYGVLHFLEANLIPSLIDGYGSFPIAYALNLGLDYDTMLTHIVRLALNREQRILSLNK